MPRPKFPPNWTDVTSQKIGKVSAIIGAETFRKSVAMNDETGNRAAAAQGLELCYLGRLTADGDHAFIYASERFLAYDKWPSRVRDAAKNSVAVLSLRGVFPDEGARLVVFRTEDWVQSFVVAGGDLIAWVRGDTPGTFLVWNECEHAEAMFELIRQASE
jgi:hypothetical protein